MSEREERKEKFTPGPWEVDHDFPADVRASSVEKDVACTSLDVIRFNVGDREESYANAALIAAAPDMYAKLESLKRYVSESCGDACGSILVIREIDALLAKARGES